MMCPIILFAFLTQINKAPSSRVRDLSDQIKLKEKEASRIQNPHRTYG